MSNGTDIDRFVTDPSLLIDLCHEVIDQLDAGSDDAASQEKEAQLREIAKAVERLEKMGVAVPDALRERVPRTAAPQKPPGKRSSYGASQTTRNGY